MVMVLGLVKVATRPGSLRASLAGLVGLLAACAGRPPRAERGVGGGGGCQMRLPNPPARSPCKQGSFPRTARLLGGRAPEP